MENQDLTRAEKEYRVFIGSYADAAQPGIYSYRMRIQDGHCQMELLATESQIANPSFLDVDKERGLLFAVSETGDGHIVSYRINADTGELTRICEQATLGSSPCHVLRMDGESAVLCVNYMGGNVSAFSFHEGTGQLTPAFASVKHEGHGPNPSRQEAPHPHSAWLDPSGRFVFVVDLGIDRICRYRVDVATKAMVRDGEVAVSAGAGPRHLVFHPSGRFVYVVNELGSTVTAFAYHQGGGEMHELETVSTLPIGFTGTNTAAAIRISHDGRFLYVSNRGDDSIATFAVDETSGRLSPIGHESTKGLVPRDFNLTPDSRCLLAANQESDSITAFAIDTTTGVPRFVGQVASISHPTCIQIV